jgi:hypothetical protein
LVHPHLLRTMSRPCLSPILMQAHTRQNYPSSWEIKHIMCMFVAAWPRSLLAKAGQLATEITVDMQQKMWASQSSALAVS